MKVYLSNGYSGHGDSHLLFYEERLGKKTIELDEGTCTEIEMTDDYVSLDVENYQRVHKIIKCNGELVDDYFLLVNWQGDLPEGKIMTLDELKVHLYGLGRNVEDYMYRIGQLSGEEISPLSYVYTTSEAEDIWGFYEGKLRSACSRGILRHYIDRGLVKQSGGTWLIHHKAMLEVYGVPKKGG